MKKKTKERVALEELGLPIDHEAARRALEEILAGVCGETFTPPSSASDRILLAGLSNIKKVEPKP